MPSQPVSLVEPVFITNGCARQRIDHGLSRKKDNYVFANLAAENNLLDVEMSPAETVVSQKSKTALCSKKVISEL